MNDTAFAEYGDVDAFLLEERWVVSTCWPKLHPAYLMRFMPILYCLAYYSSKYDLHDYYPFFLNETIVVVMQFLLNALNLK